MNIAVLGSNGFIGRYLYNQLASKGYTAIPVTRQTLNLSSNTAVRQFLINNNIDTVINCAIAGGSKAGISQENYNDLQENIIVFLNFYNNAELFSKYINVGSGAEFDLDKNNDSIQEHEIFNRHPRDSYGFSKNTISRLCLEKDNFYTLRLFGCFGGSESEFRLFKKFKNNQEISLKDRQFDYFSIQDYLTVVEHYINNGNLPKDVNCVYKDKLLLSKVLEVFARYHCDKSKIKIVGTDLNNYTGDCKIIQSLNLNLLGLEESLKRYYE